MHSTQLAEAQALANQRLVAAATTLAERSGLDPALVEALGVTTRHPEVTFLRQREATAAILEALVGAAEEPADEKPAARKESVPRVRTAFTSGETTGCSIAARP